MVESNYERARKWLEDEGPITEYDFRRRYFNEPLFKAKGAEWEREGLIIPQIGKTQTTKEFFAELNELKKEKKRKVGFIQTKRGRRKVAFVNLTIRGKRYRKGQYVPLTKKEKVRR